jgi:hypothetical protein
MAAYTSRLFEALKAEGAPASTASPDRGSRVAALASTTGGGGRGALQPGAAAPAAAGTAPTGAATTLEDCYAVIRFQRTQIGQLRSRCGSLEEQLAQVSAAVVDVLL